MIKCNINKAKGLVKVKATGTAKDMTVETMAIIGEVYRGIRKNNETAAEMFRLTLVSFFAQRKGSHGSACRRRYGKRIRKFCH